ncbi:PEGA domain-containing protein [Candidatus Saccharibacteria bacterium]|nr:PEGA domain-containing protein [Candidatus Saccharibacteria bacterium]
MDFLDPRKRRAHTIRLMVGYVLVAIAIGLGGWLLLKAASGYGVDPKTGDIVQNGLLFVGSKPGGADIYINDNLQGSQTSARLILPAGNYKLTLKKDGYRTWERSITLNEGSVARYVYPFLFPAEPQPQTIKEYTKAPPLITQSPDRRWLLVQRPTSSSGSITFDEFDAANLTKQPRALVFPSGLLTSLTSSTLKEVEWSTDNKHLLLRHSFKGGNEFIIFNRDIPAESINVNKLFDISPTEVALRDKKIDQLYVFLQNGGQLQIASTANSVVTPLLKDVLAFKPSGTNLISYATGQNAPSGQVIARIWDDSQSYALYTFRVGGSYLVDEAQFQGHWYYVVGSNEDERVNVYKDPLGSLKNPAIGRAVPLLSLNIIGATKVSFSNNTRFIAAEAGQKLAVYDLETQSIYRYTLENPLAGILRWMDGHRLIGASNGSVFVTDYDSTNQQTLVPTNYSGGGFFDPNYEQLFTTAVSKAGVVLQRVDMRAGVDLPR